MCGRTGSTGGKLDIESGSVLDTGAHYLVIQSPVAEEAICTIDDPSSVLNVNQMDLGWYDDHGGELRQYGGTVRIDEFLTLGSRSRAEGKYILTDGELGSPGLHVGYEGTGSSSRPAERYMP